MNNIHIDAIKKTFPNIKVIDYLITLRLEKWYIRILPFVPYEQLHIFLLSDGNIVGIRITGSGRVCSPEILKGVRISTKKTLMSERLLIENTSKYNGEYWIIRKSKGGEFASKKEFLQALTKEKRL